MGILIKLAGRRGSAMRALAIRVLASLLVLGAAQNASAEPDATAEYRVKAAFLYKFGDYIEWPEQAFARPDSPLTIGIVGADFLADELARLVTGRTMSGRRVVVRKLRPSDALGSVHLLFVGRSTSGQIGDLQAATRGRAVVTVTEADPAQPPHSVINFVVVQDKVRFDIYLQPAEEANLKISARLLAVARKVLSSPS